MHATLAVMSRQILSAKFWMCWGQAKCPHLRIGLNEMRVDAAQRPLKRNKPLGEIRDVGACIAVLTGQPPKLIRRQWKLDRPRWPNDNAIFLGAIPRRHEEVSTVFVIDLHAVNCAMRDLVPLPD